MLIKFDQKLVNILCCPICKSDLQMKNSGFSCQDCNLLFPLTEIKIGEGHLEKVYDFRINRPSYCIPQSKVLWQETQMSYEQFSDEFGSRDMLQEYLDEIDSVKEIYTEEYHISGSVLDIGGHQGRLRHFLGNDVDLYVSIDPHIEVFQGLDEQPNLLKAYPCLSESCNFLSAHAEYLPFKSRSFDWVHMRSVVDHFEDPYKAFLEAYRVSRIGGRLLVGLAILEKIKISIEENSQISVNENLSAIQSATQSDVPFLQRVYSKWKNEGWTGLYRAVLRRIFHLSITPAQPVLQIKKVEANDDHMYRFTHLQLMDLMERTGWKVTKQHWQKQPYYYCIYAMGEAQPPQNNN